MASRNSHAQQQRLIGYPCNEYKRFSDTFDIKKFYECGVQPDGDMRIVHKMCPRGEEFCPKFSECVMTAYLKTTNRHRRMNMMNHCEKEEECNKGKKKPVSCPEPPEPNDDDEPEPANEWVDISKGTGRKVPQEFKPKPKTRLRIYHLHCKRRPGRMSHDDYLAKVPRVRRAKKLEKPPRSYVIRVNKKNHDEEELKSEDNDEDEEDDEEEEEEEEDGEAEKPKAAKKEASKNVQSGFVRRVQQKSGASLFVDNPKIDSKTGASTKIILDADVRLNSAFGDALQKILKARKLSKKGANDNGGSGSLRSRRNFFHGLFSKKKKTNDKDKNAEKEALVNLDHIINGVTSEFEREALLQKLEQKKNKASKIQRSEWRKKKSTEFNIPLSRRTYYPHEQSHHRTIT